MRHHSGSLEVICGSMFCGKTEELIRRLRRAEIARQKVQVFKPIIDDRYLVAKVASHSGSAFEALPIEKSSQIFDHLEKSTTVVGIDEAQFFDSDIIEVIARLVNDNKRVICAGLDTDFRGVPFGVMPTLMALAEHIDKLQAICMVCGEPASKTQRLVNGNPAYYDDPIIIVGASEMYEARCRLHHKVPRK
ncbi:MAG TPA: thymidine kinase [Anaerolineaceae bacterium]|nr:thymidine kinase [Anaerolineaceae bacterium]